MMGRGLCRSPGPGKGKDSLSTLESRPLLVRPPGFVAALVYAGSLATRVGRVCSLNPSATLRGNATPTPQRVANHPEPITLGATAGT